MSLKKAENDPRSWRTERITHFIFSRFKAWVSLVNSSSASCSCVGLLLELMSDFPPVWVNTDLPSLLVWLSTSRPALQLKLFIREESGETSAWLQKREGPLPLIRVKREHICPEDHDILHTGTIFTILLWNESKHEEQEHTADPQQKRNQNQTGTLWDQIFMFSWS